MTIPYIASKIDAEKDVARYRQARAIREAVFILEQGLMVEENWEKIDFGFSHFIVQSLFDSDIIGSARLGEVTQGCQTRPVAKIEWVCILPEYRNQGAGRILMAAILDDVQRSGYKAAYLQANIGAVSFYEACGFETEGFAFEENGLTYYAMRCMI